MTANDVTVDVGEPAVSLSAPVLPERIAGRYEIVGLLGVGGMGSVYRVRDLELGEVVALKFLRRDFLEEPAMLDRFREEVRLARRVTHVNVARTFDIGEHAGERFLTMELVDGEPLSRLLTREGALPVPRAIELTRALCLGLAAAHEAGVVHRDIKPDNVMVTGTRVVVMDFGIAHAHDGRGRGGVVGTPAYMAPEQLSGGPVDARTDLYAVGAVLHELLTGRAAWIGESYAALALARLEAPPPDPRALVPDLPPALAAVVTRCLAVDPAARFASAAALAEALAGGGDAHTPAAEPRVRALRVAPAPIEDACTVAIRAFHNDGPADDAWLAVELADALADELCSAAGVRVRPRSLVAQHPIDTDARAVGRALDVQVVVDGSLRRHGDRVRIAARAISVGDGFQVWARRIERPATEVLDATGELAAAIAQSLATRVVTRTRGPLPGDAAERFLRARQSMRRTWAGTGDVEETVRLFEDVHRVAPDDPDVLAYLAMARARWLNYSPIEVPAAPDEIRALARRAVAIAPHLGEPWLALATIEFVTSDWAAAARALRHALACAPGTVRAHDMLGHIEGEVGRIDEAIFRLETALSLDPTAIGPRMALAMRFGLEGRLDRHDALLALPVENREELSNRTFARMRSNIWRGARRYELIPAEMHGPFTPMWRLLMDTFASQQISAASRAAFDERIARTRPGSRMMPLALQLYAELLAFTGDFDGALAKIQQAADHALYDLHWLDTCPVFAPMRTDPAWDRARDVVVARIAPVLAALDGPLE